MTEVSTEVEVNKPIGIIRKVGAALQNFGQRVHDETVGPDLGKAIQQLKKEGESGKILNPTGLKVGEAVTKAVGSTIGTKLG